MPKRSGCALSSIEFMMSTIVTFLKKDQKQTQVFPIVLIKPVRP